MNRTPQGTQLRYSGSGTYAATPSPQQHARQAAARQQQHSLSAPSFKRARYDDEYAYYGENDQHHQHIRQPFEQRASIGVSGPTNMPPLLHSFQIRHRSSDKTRGLRHFAHKVCAKVKEKVQTNYNEVADELVTEYFDQLDEIPTDPEKFQYDTRNIRRRVYDALNVLMAMNIIEKEKKEIRWVGLPTSSLAECRRLEEEKIQRQDRICHKTEQLQELIIQLVAYKSLVQRNRECERLQGRPPDSSILYLPYIIVSTDRKTMVECAIAPDKSEYWFNFDRPFEIHDDIEVLKRLGLVYGIDRGEVDPNQVKHIKACLPPALRDYVDQILEGTLNTQETKELDEFGGHGDRKSLVKLDPNTGTIRPAYNEPIVVRATRASLSGVATAGDGGPMRSFLGPMASSTGNRNTALAVAGAHPPARLAVIPRPVSARYGSTSGGVTRYHVITHQPHFDGGRARLGGVLHDHYDYQDQYHHQPGMAYNMAGDGMMEEYPMDEYGEMVEEHHAQPGDHQQQMMVVGDEEEVVTEGGPDQY